MQRFTVRHDETGEIVTVDAHSFEHAAYEAITRLEYATPSDLLHVAGGGQNCCGQHGTDVRRFEISTDPYFIGMVSLVPHSGAEVA